MAYLCSRCEAEDHPNMSKGRVRNIAGDIDDGVSREIFTNVMYCEGCSSNTVHVSDGGNLLANE